MLRGVYNLSGAPAGEIGAVARLGPRPIVRGPLAIAADDELRAGDAGEISCVMDGMLYEPSSLAREVGGDGPELLARGYRRYGLGALPLVRGSFATVLWDARRRRGALACDLLATRPVYVRRGVGWLAFAGEIDELLALLPSRPAPDQEAFVMWLAMGSPGGGATLYEGVSRLGPGEAIELTEGGARTRTYWRPRYRGTLPGTAPELAQGLRHEIEQAARRRLSVQSNAVILSGGLDSSIVAALASRAAPPQARFATYSAVFPGEEYDESAKVREMTSALRIEAIALQLAPQGTLWLALRHLKRRQLPLSGAGALIDITAVGEAARDGVRVVLDGQTGDELFGMAPHLLSDLLLRGRLLAAVALARRWPVGRPVTRQDVSWLLTHVGLKGLAPHRLRGRARHRRDADALAPAWMPAGHRRRYVELDDTWSWKLGPPGPRWWRHLSDLLIQTPHRDTRLDYLRHRAADAGVTSGTPLYDADLIDYVLRLPPQLAFDPRFTRPLARAAVRGIVPDAVRLQTRKAVFSAFCMAALTGADLPAMRRLIEAPDAELGAYVDMAWVRRFWGGQRPQPGESSTFWGTMAWRLAVGEAWLRIQGDPGFADEMLARPDVPAPSARRVALSDPALFSDWRPHPGAPKI
ncbi:MAG: asparagine synthase-related protein [Solirubrobacteraceae bacterium]